MMQGTKCDMHNSEYCKTISKTKSEEKILFLDFYRRIFQQQKYTNYGTRSAKS